MENKMICEEPYKKLSVTREGSIRQGIEGLVNNA